MKIAHVLRKYDPLEWGGTETSLKRLLEAFNKSSITSVIFCPKNLGKNESDPFKELGVEIRYFPAFLPIIGITEENKKRLLAVGGNLISFRLIWMLLREPNLSVIHAHTLGAIGGICRWVAKIRKIPFIITIHGGVLDLPKKSLEALTNPMKGGFSFGRLFNWPLRTKHLLEDADAVLTVNAKEADLIRQKYPHQRVILTSHTVPQQLYLKDCRSEARNAFPDIVNRRMFLTVGRIDPVKNQLWVIERMPEVLRKYPSALYVIVGPITDSAYYDILRKKIDELGLNKSVLFLEPLPPDDPRLIGLFQEALAFLLPSLAEPFGIVILEAWASETPVISSRTSGAETLLKNEETGYLFDLDNPETFFKALEISLENESIRERMILNGRKRVKIDYDITVNGIKMEKLYHELVELKKGPKSI